MKKQLLFATFIVLLTGGLLACKSEKKQSSRPTITLHPGETRIFLGKKVTVLSDNATVEPAGRWKKGEWRVKPQADAQNPVEITVLVEQ